MAIQSHRDLVVWQKAMELVVCVYRLSRSFPKEEVYGLTSQLRRAVVSVPANIAEGHCRTTAKDYASFLAIARGSVMEAETLLLIAVRLGYATEAACSEALSMCQQISKMLTSLRATLLKRSTSQSS